MAEIVQNADREDRPELRDTISASQLDTYQLCPRKWAWRKLDGVIMPPNPSAAFGLKVHGQLEKWLRHGIPLDLTTEEGEVAMAGLHHLPAPGAAGMQIEEEFILSGWNHRFFGLKDVQILYPAGLNFNVDENVPLVIDHKTTKDFKWAKDQTVLPGDIQAALYAADAMIKTGADKADLRWVYYRTKRPFKSKAIDVRVTREQIEPTLGKIKRLADEISAIKKSGLKTLDLPYNAGACDAFGGCAYRHLCNLTSQDRMTATMSTEASPIGQSERDRLYAQIQARANAAGAGAAINPPSLAPPPVAAAAPGIPPGAPISPDGKHFYDGTAWQPIPAVAPPPPVAAPPPPPVAAPPPPPPPVAAPPPPPPPPPVAAPPPPPPPPPVAAAAPGIPPGAPISPDGKHFYDGTSWKPVPSQDTAAAPKARRGRPPRSAGAAPAPGDPNAETSTAESMLAAAYEDIGNGFLAAAEAIKLGALR